jgi:Protein of unknown function (DUF3592)
MAEHTLEPELASPPPRQVRARDGWSHGCGLWFIRLFCLPHTLAGVFLACVAVSAVLLNLGVLIVGTDVDGRIVKKSETVTKKGTHRTIDYTFTLNGHDYTARKDVGEEAYYGFAEGDAIRVRVLALAPQAGHWPAIPGLWPLGQVAITCVVAAIWNGILAVFVWHLYIRPWRQRRLVRYGQPVPGTVSDVKSAIPRRGPAYTVTYVYKLPFDPTTGDADRYAMGKATVEAPQSAANVRPGDILTVLYDPRRPTRSLLYRFSDYKAG